MTDSESKERDEIALRVLPALARMIRRDTEGDHHFHSPETGSAVAYMWADAFLAERERWKSGGKAT